MYQRGVDALLHGDATSAVALLQAAAGEDPSCAAAWAALAVALAACASPRTSAVVRRALKSVTLGDVCRRDRQHVEVLCLSVGSQRSRASVLAREHVLEFPDDALVRYVVEVLERE